MTEMAAGGLYVIGMAPCGVSEARFAQLGGWVVGVVALSLHTAAAVTST